MIALTQSDQLDIDAVIAAQEQIDKVDSVNQVVVARLLEKGWPQGLSDEAHHTIWLVIDHAPLDYQLRYLPLVEAQMVKGVISKSDYAHYSTVYVCDKARHNAMGHRPFSVVALRRMRPFTFGRSRILASSIACVARWGSRQSNATAERLPKLTAHPAFTIHD